MRDLKMVNLKVPKKYLKYFGHLEINPDWYEDPEEEKYILYYAEGYAYSGEYPIMYLKTKKEVLEYLTYAEKEIGYEKEE